MKDISRENNISPNPISDTMKIADIFEASDIISPSFSKIMRHSFGFLIWLSERTVFQNVRRVFTASYKVVKNFFLILATLFLLCLFSPRIVWIEPTATRDLPWRPRHHPWWQSPYLNDPCLTVLRPPGQVVFTPWGLHLPM